MAISRERLEELIERDKVFYWVFNKEIRMLCNLSTPTYWKRKWELYGKDCFETKEEAEWHLEFGNIVKPCKLDLPTWEDIEKDDNFHYIRHYHVNKSCFFIEIYKFTNTIEIYWHEGVLKTNKSYKDTWSLTKENYIEACRKAKELFMGDERDE